MKEFIDNKQYIIVPKFSRYQEFLALLAGAERAVWCWYDGKMVRVSPSPSGVTGHCTLEQTCLIRKTLSDSRDHRSSASVAAGWGNSN